MPKIEDELKQKYYAFLDKKIEERKIPLESGHYELLTLSATFWLSRLSQYHQAKMEELEKRVEGNIDTEFCNSTDVKTAWFYKGKNHTLSEVLKIIREER